MSVEACAGIVERGDPERFRAIMVSPPAARRILFPLFALNIEVARAPWVTQEAMIAEMRLQWWRDALDELSGNGAPRRHEVVDALADILDSEGVGALDALIAARRWDIYKDAFENQHHFQEYLSATSGNLIWTAARLLGRADEVVVRDASEGIAIANLLRASSELETRGRKPLMDGTPEGIRALAQHGLDALDRATSARRAVSKDASPALLTGWAARPILRQAVAEPQRVASGDLRVQALRLPRLALLGWWR